MLVLVPVLALGGCGGSGGSGDDGGDAGAPSSSAPSSAASSAPASGGKSPATVAPQVSAAAQQFNDCMHDQGVELPTPNPTSTPPKKDLEKMKAALQTCMRKMQPTPPAGTG